ncbi:hypothetical protein GTZ99_02705 [Novosphingobium sp. FSY-8]|uniref:G domain-containing protein n=1 Tax=Novosphingobium ovatum TaxID=1908523 RepID=A0ABW9XAA0_9SPHN|nr:GTPase domain-containing protein [Novosphingobium ovatum]NBC35463.1 hypothetical protein [Novosphingobium ovatum]
MFRFDQSVQDTSSSATNGSEDDFGPQVAANRLVSESKQRLDEKLKEIWQSLDWKEPNIAFYGETNAGKSTLIEALRALFDAAEENQGDSIGNGLPDYTRKATSYPCEYDGARFNLIDVPGIEGKETEVIAEIEHAINNAHAVFYVTADARPPQGGDEHREGTLEKIKRQLKPQAKVWAIYNKKIKNPRAINSALINHGEEESLSKGPHSLDGKMREVLGEHYQCHIAVSALPGFFALANSLPTNSDFISQREKFVTMIGIEKLLECSSVEKLGKLLRQNVPSQDDIINANIKKLAPPIEEAISLLDQEAEKQFAVPVRELSNQLDKLGPELELIADDASKGMNRLTDELTNGCVKRVREKMLEAIKSGLGGDQELKIKLEQILEEEKARLPDTVNARVSGIVKRTYQSCKEALYLVEKHLKDAHAFESPSFASSFLHAVNVDTSSGINWGGLLGVAGGIAITLLTGGTFGAIAAITTAFSFVRSVWNFFSRDYMKDQQRQSLNKNLDSIKPNIQRNIVEALKTMEDNLRANVLGLMNPLRSVEEELQNADRSVRRASHELKCLISDNARICWYVEGVLSPGLETAM